MSLPVSVSSCVLQPSVPEQLPGGGPPGRRPPGPQAGGDEARPGPGVRLRGRQRETGGGSLRHTR